MLTQNTHVMSIVLTMALVMMPVDARAQDGGQEHQHDPDQAQEIRADPSLPVNDFVHVEPQILDFGKTHRGEELVGHVTLSNVSDVPVMIARTFTTCGCTVPSIPREALAPGTSAEVEIRYNAKSAGPAATTVRFFLDQNRGDVQVVVRAHVQNPIEIEPSVFPAELKEPFEIKLISTDGSAFRVMAVDPPVLDGVDETHRVVQTLLINPEKLAKAGNRRHSIRIYTSHKRIDAVQLRSDAIQNTPERNRLLAWASGEGAIEDLPQLLDNGADLRTTDPQGRTSLMLAALAGDLERSRMLLDFGANVNHVAQDRQTVLMMAAQSRQTRPGLLQLFLDAGCDVNGSDKYGRTALHWSARVGTPECIDVLLQRGAVVNVAGSGGETPLHAAVKSAKLENVKALLDAGARKNVPDRTGRRPIDFARIALMYTDGDRRAQVQRIISLLE